MRNFEGRNIKLTGMQSYCYQFIVENDECTTNDIFKSWKGNYNITKSQIEKYCSALIALKVISKCSNGLTSKKS